MKKRIHRFALFALLCTSLVHTAPLSAQGVIVAYINKDSIINVHPQKFFFDKHISDATTEYESELNRMKTDYNKKIKDYLKNNNELITTIKLARQAEITEAEKRIASYKMQYQAVLQNERDSLTKILQNDITRIINQVAKEKNITIVLDKKDALYLDSTCIDLFPLVEQKLLQK